MVYLARTRKKVEMAYNDCMSKHLVVLSGNSLKNKAWGESVLDHYASRFDSSYMQQYDHWESGASNIDFVAEQTKLAAHVATLPPDTEIILFAKSAGSLLALLAIYQGVIHPVRIVFFGMPLDLAAPDLFKDSWEPLSTLALPAIAFHNIDDPTTSYAFTQNALIQHNPAINLITTHEADHWYGDFAAYDNSLTPFLI